MPFIDTRSGTSPFYRDWGTGRPVVFYSAWGMDSTEPRTVMADLVAHGYRAIAVDRRGHGRSDDPGHGYDYDTLADDLSDVLDELNVHGATMVGYSMGGGEIVRYLTRHGSARVDRIALVAAALPFLMRTTDNPHGVPVEAADALRDSRRHGLDTWLLDNADPYIGAGLPGCEVSQATRDRVLTLILGTSPHAAIECNRAVVETDFRAELPRITVPVLIVHGDTDASVSSNSAAASRPCSFPAANWSSTRTSRTPCISRTARAWPPTCWPSSAIRLRGQLTTITDLPRV